MKQFFKFMFASMVGFILTLFLVFLLFFGMVASVAKFGESEKVEVKDNSILYVKLSTPIVDRASNNPMKNFDFMSMEAGKELGLNQILKNIEKAKKDPKIKGIFLDMSVIPAPMATVEEIRRSLLDFKDSGKFIVSYSEVYSQKAYYLASVSDKVWINPEGMLDFRGLNAQVMFMKGLLKKVGVEPQIIRHGKFKSAIEPLILEKMSEANKEQMLKYITSLWDYMLDNIAKERKVTKEELNAIADEMKIETGKNAVENKLADAALYKDEVLAELRTLLGIKDKDKIQTVSLASYTNAQVKKDKKFSKNKIAVVYAQGSIVGGEGEDGQIASESVSKTLRKVREDSTIKAVVFRVNSGGGSALASEVILREVELIKKEKPIVVSMGDYAASGGYWIACLANKIYASPTTLTGSIGVFGVIPNMQELFNDKLGLTMDNVKTNEYADLGDVSRPLRDLERAKITNSVEHIYDLFLDHVSKGRNMTKEQVDSIGQGRIWSGVDAKKLGLIDEFGGLNEAIDGAIELSGLEEYRIVEYPKLKDPFMELIKNLKTEARASIFENELGSVYEDFKTLKEMTTSDTYQARLPFVVRID